MLQLIDTVATIAHAGHDHTWSIAGQWHHVFWIGLATLAVGFLGYKLTRRSKKR